jgi:hypothetical protein
MYLSSFETAAARRATGLLDLIIEKNFTFYPAAQNCMESNR